MHSDTTFLSNLTAEPSDDVTRLVYADWLQEQSDAGSAEKAEFLRLTVELAANPKKKGWKKKAARLQQLAAELDTDWLAVVSRLFVENCHPLGEDDSTSPAESVVKFAFPCAKRWEDLRPTNDPEVRACDACKQNVHYCETIMEAREHAWEGRCIAVDLGVIRREGDLEREQLWLGLPSAEILRQERERMQPDAVSAERERKKREGK